MGSLCSKDPNFPVVFREELLKAKFGVRPAGCVTFFWLEGGEVTGWSFRNLVLSLKLPSSSWVVALVLIEELRDIVMYIPWGGTRTLIYSCTIVSWLFFFCFCIPSLPWLVTAWICPLELREGLGDWNLFSTNNKWGTWKCFCTQEFSTGSCSVSDIVKELKKTMLKKVNKLMMRTVFHKVWASVQR